jgi:GDPmannose 4,6-dehydratase
MHTVREFCTLAFDYVGIKLDWIGSGVEEKGINTENGQVIVEVDPRFFRPTEVEQLLGDPSKAVHRLGWNPTKTSFSDLVKKMVEHDYNKVAGEYDSTVSYDLGEDK